MTAPELLTAFLAGLLSFFSPCVLPLIPTYLSFLTGYEIADLREEHHKGRVFIRTLAFIGGFTVVFTLLGIVFAGGSALLGPRNSPSLRQILPVVSGLLVVGLGLNLLFEFLGILSRDTRFRIPKAPRGVVDSVLFGMAFAAGWSPCIGPILASILFMAADASGAGPAAVLLGTYSLGLALPFLVTGLFFGWSEPLLRFLRRHGGMVKTLSGLLLIGMGTAMIFGQLGMFSSWAVQGVAALQEISDRHPGVVRWVAVVFWLSLATVPLWGTLGRNRRPWTFVRVGFTAGFAVLALLEGWLGGPAS